MNSGIPQMKIIETAIPGVLIIEPDVFEDERGFFLESYNERRFAKATSAGVRFVQDNHSKSIKNVLRGLHYQIQQPQGKLVRVIAGEVFDVAVDIRRSSPTFGRYVTMLLSARDKRSMWIPVGFAHGFLVTSNYAEVLYKTTDYWAPQHERCIVWNDTQLKIRWPIQGAPLLSEKDRQGAAFVAAEVFP